MNEKINIRELVLAEAEMVISQTQFSQSQFSQSQYSQSQSQNQHEKEGASEEVDTTRVDDTSSSSSFSDVEEVDVGDSAKKAIKNLKIDSRIFDDDDDDEGENDVKTTDRLEPLSDTKIAALDDDDDLFDDLPTDALDESMARRLALIADFEDEDNGGGLGQRRRVVDSSSDDDYLGEENSDSDGGRPSRVRKSGGDDSDSAAEPKGDGDKDGHVDEDGKPARRSRRQELRKARGKKGSKSAASLATGNDQEDRDLRKAIMASMKGLSDEEKKRIVLNTEINAMKELEKGPSEADVRRRQLIEIDEEIMEERIEKMKNESLRRLKRLVNAKIKSQRVKLMELKGWLKNHLRSSSDDVKTWIEEELQLSSERLLIHDGSTVDYAGFLRSDDDGEDDDADDEEEEEESPVEDDPLLALASGKSASKAPSKESCGGGEQETKGEMVMLSDSDESDQDEIKVVPPPVVAPVVADAKPSPAKHALINRYQGMLKLTAAPSARQNLKQNLKKKVLIAANENLCKQIKISVTQLALRSQISENCRTFVDLLRYRQDRRRNKQLLKEESERIRRRERFQQLANDDNDDEFSIDDEFGLHGDGDEDDLDHEGSGAPMTEEEKRAFLEKFERDVAAELEKEDDADDEGSEDEDEYDAEAYKAMIAAREAAAAAASTANGDDDGEDDDNDQMDAEGVERAGDDDEDESHVVLTSRLGSIKKSGRAFIDDDNEAVPGESSIQHGHQQAGEDDDDIRDSDDEGQATKLVHKHSSSSQKLESASSAASDHDDHGGDKDDEHHPEQASSPSPSPQPQPRKKKDVNIEYRRLLAEEERRYRRERDQSSNAAHMMLDMEANEEEEEGLQAGLGDFGFGKINKDNDDNELDALRIRKGDLDHIVDTISDDEGDDEAAVIARAEQEFRDDRERTKAIITGVTQGRQAVRKEKSRGKYTLDKLLTGRDELELERKKVGENGEGVVDDEEFDEEEMLQQGLQRKAELERNAARSIINRESDSESDDEDEDAEAAAAALLAQNMTDEEIAAALRQRELEREIKERQKIQRMEFQKQVKMNQLLKKHGGLTTAILPSAKQAFSLDDDFILPPLSISPRAGAATPSLAPTPTSGVSSASSQPRMTSFSPVTVDDKPATTPTATQSGVEADTSTAAEGFVQPKPLTGSSSSSSLADITNTHQQHEHQQHGTGDNSHGVIGRSAVNKRKSDAPKRLVGVPTRAHTVAGLSRTRSIPAGASAAVPTSSMYIGALSQAEVDAGYGMGMAVTNATLKRSFSSAGMLPDKNGASNNGNESGKSFFSAVVVGSKRSASDGSNTTSTAAAATTSTMSSGSVASITSSHHRSFMAAAKRRNTSSASLSSSVPITAASQFVFAAVDDASTMMGGEHSRGAGEHSRGGNSKIARSHSVRNVGEASGEGGASTSRLFANLAKSNSVIKRATSVSAK